MSSENFNIGQGTAPNWGDYNTQTDSTTAPTPTSNVPVGDSISLTNAQGSFVLEVKNYLNAAHKPSLTPSTSNQPDVASATLEHLFNFNNMFEGIMQMAGTPPPGSPAAEYSKQLASIHVDDPEIIALAQAEGMSPGELLNGIQKQGEFLFEQKLAGLPKEIADKLRFAHNNPEAAKNLSPELKAMLNSFEGEVTTQLRQEYGFTAEWKGVPVDNADFNKGITNQFDETFENEVNNLKDSGQITDQQAQQLRNLHYGLADKTTADPKLANIFENLENAAASAIRDQYGADVSFQPKADTTYYTAVINGHYQEAFQKALDGYNPPLSAADKALVIKSFTNPGDPTIPANIKQIAQAIQAAAVKSVIDEFALPPTWVPTVSSPVPVLSGGLKMAQNALSMIKEVSAAAQEMISKMPDGPDKLTYLDFLKIIGAAINKLQDLLYALQTSDSIRSKELGKGKLDTALNQIAKQQKQADEVKEKMRKMAALGPLKALFEWLIKLIMIITAFFLGPVMLAIVLTYMVDSTKAEVTHTTSLCQEMFQAISKGCGEGGGIALKVFVAFAMSMGNPLLLMNLIGQDSHVVQDFVGVCGGDKTAQQMTAMVVNMIFQMAIMFPLILLSGGAAGPAEIAPALANTLRVEIDMAMMYAKVANIAYQAIMASLTVSQQGMSINNNVLKAQIEMIKASGDAYAQEAQALIQILKKLIQKLLDSMNGRSDEILDLSQFQSKKYNDVSQITTELFG